MISVSNAFKENIKKNVRQINAFVEVLIGGGYFCASEDTTQDIVITSSDKADITNLNSVTDKSSNFNRYTCLEQDYITLDGSFLLANEDYQNKDTGYVSNTIGSGEVEISYNNSIFAIRDLTRRSKLITIYFEDGYATDFDVTFNARYRYVYNSAGSYYEEDEEYTFNVTDNDKGTVTIGQDIPDVVDDTYNFYCLTGVEITVNSWSVPNRRVRIRQINAGETMLFKDGDLIEINIDEQTSLYNTETPNNECNVVLNNYDRKFNIVDKNSILNKFDKTTYIRPFIGVSTGGGIEYVDMGSYNYSSYVENQNKTITLYGAGSMQSFETEKNYLTIYQSGHPFSTVLISNAITSAGAGVGTIFYNGSVSLYNTNTNNLREQLQSFAIFSCDYIKEDRSFDAELNNYVRFYKQTFSSLDRIPLTLQINEPKIERTTKTKKIKFTNTQVGTLDNTEKVLVQDYEVNGDFPNVYINSSVPIDLGSLKVYSKIGNGNYEEVYAPAYDSYYSPYVTVWGDFPNGGYIKITGKTYNSTNIETTMENENIKDGSTLEYNNGYLSDNYNKRIVANYIFNNERDFRFKVDFNGDPSFEVGDTITFETVDGDMKGTIDKISIRYNGGLQETIEGECNSVLQ